ncbi:hypothetical protein BC833DRAFT_221411 [Globomyces pollinis-pini]|nr:hypothetical protein BC833DRAFT_221411 [Globomyces pollinis-pini]
MKLGEENTAIKNELTEMEEARNLLLDAIDVVCNDLENQADEGDGQQLIDELQVQLQSLKNGVECLNDKIDVVKVNLQQSTVELFKQESLLVMGTENDSDILKLKKAELLKDSNNKMINSLNLRLDQLMKENDGLATQLESIKDKLDVETTKTSEQEREIETLSKQKEESEIMLLKSNSVILEKDNKIVELLTQERNDKLLIRNLESQINELSEAKSKILDLEGDIQLMRKESTHYKLEIQTLTNQLQLKKEEEDQSAQYKLEIQTLKDQLQLKKEQDQSAQYKLEIETLKNELQLKKEQEELKETDSGQNLRHSETERLNDSKQNYHKSETAESNSLFPTNDYQHLKYMYDSLNRSYTSAKRDYNMAFSELSHLLGEITIERDSFKESNRLLIESNQKLTRNKNLNDFPCLDQKYNDLIEHTSAVESEFQKSVIDRLVLKQQLAEYQKHRDKEAYEISMLKIKNKDLENSLENETKRSTGLEEELFCCKRNYSEEIKSLKGNGNSQPNMVTNKEHIDSAKEDESLKAELDAMLKSLRFAQSTSAHLSHDLVETTRALEKALLDNAQMVETLSNVRFELEKTSNDYNTLLSSNDKGVGLFNLCTTCKSKLNNVKGDIQSGPLVSTDIANSEETQAKQAILNESEVNLKRNSIDSATRETELVNLQQLNQNLESKLKETLLELERKSKQMLGTTNKLNEELSQAKNKSKQLDNELKSIRREHAEQLVDLDNKMASLHEELSICQARNKAIEKQLANKPLLADTLNNNGVSSDEFKLVSSNNTQGRSGSLNQDTKKLEERIQTLEASIIEHVKHRESMAGLIRQMQSDFDYERKNNESMYLEKCALVEKQQLKIEQMSQNEKISEAHNQNANTETQLLQNQIADLQKDITEHMRHRESMAGLIRQMQSGFDIERKNNESMYLEQCQLVEKQNIQIEQLTQEKQPTNHITSSNIDNQELQNQITELQKRISEHVKHRESMATLIRQMQNDFDIERKNNDSMYLEKCQLLEKQKLQIEQLTHEKQSNNHNTSASSENQVLQNQIAELQKRISEHVKHRESMATLIRQMQNDFDIERKNNESFYTEKYHMFEKQRADLGNLVREHDLAHQKSALALDSIFKQCTAVISGLKQKGIGSEELLSLELQIEKRNIESGILQFIQYCSQLSVQIYSKGGDSNANEVNSDECYQSAGVFRDIWEGVVNQHQNGGSIMVKKGITLYVFYPIH